MNNLPISHIESSDDEQEQPSNTSTNNNDNAVAIFKKIEQALKMKQIDNKPAVIPDEFLNAFDSDDDVIIEEEKRSGMDALVELEGIAVDTLTRITKEFHNKQKLRVQTPILFTLISLKLSILKEFPSKHRFSVDADLERHLKRLMKEEEETGTKVYLDEIENSPEFTNPDSAQRIIENMDVYEIGTNCPVDLFNPKKVIEDPLDFYDGIARRQAEMLQKQYELSKKKQGIEAFVDKEKNDNRSKKASHWDSVVKDKSMDYKKHLFFKKERTEYSDFLEQKKREAMMSHMLDDDF